MMNDFMLLSDIIFPWSNATDQKIHRWKEYHHQQETTLEQRPPLRKTRNYREDLPPNK